MVPIRHCALSFCHPSTFSFMPPVPKVVGRYFPSLKSVFIKPLLLLFSDAGPRLKSGLFYYTNLSWEISERGSAIWSTVLLTWCLSLHLIPPHTPFRSCPWLKQEPFPEYSSACVFCCLEPCRTPPGFQHKAQGTNTMQQALHAVWSPTVPLPLFPLTVSWYIQVHMTKTI